MNCPIDARLAAAASGEDLAALAHARDCVRCRAVIEEQRELIAAVRMAGRPPLRSSRRAALAAEVMAQSDLDAPRWRGERVMFAASIVVAAALALIMIGSRSRAISVPSAPDIASSDEPALEVVGHARIEPVAVPRPASVIATGADFARIQRGDHDVVTLRDGEVSVDATDREPITIVAGDTRVTIASSRAKVTARRGVIVTTHVFAGTAHVTTRGHSHVIDAGDVWIRDPEPAEHVPPVSPAADALAAFRAGWEALREHRHADAITEFDRATDPVVAEDATFWAAIATERAGDRDAAAIRLRAFLEHFPTSPRAEAARAALDRVTR